MASWVPVPLITQPYESADDVELTTFNAAIIDAIPMRVGDKTHLMKRPGLIEHIDLETGAGIDGLYWYDRSRVMLAVSDGRVWKITDANGTRVELTGSTDLLSNAHVKFASDATRVVMANGGPMVHTDLSTLTTMADADAPVQVTHVASLDQYILANSTATGKIFFSDLNDMTSWQALSFFTAESRYDDVVAIAEGFREIIALGRETVEFWINDGQNPFSRIQGSAQPFGTEAPQSLALVGSTWMWLDHNRRFVAMQGRQVVPVSSPYDRVIQRYQAVDNAIGYAVSFEGMPLYVLTFPTVNETLVYNYMTQEWHKWGYWASSSGVYQRFRGAAYCYARSWNQHFIGDHSTGKIYRMSRSYFTDNGNPIRSLLRTGHINHGSHMSKRSDIFRLHCKRSAGTVNSPDPQVVLRRRVNNGQAWGMERTRSIGMSGDHNPYIDWRQNGIYRTCQYELVHSDDSDFVVMGAEEQITPLGR